jgi:hypothetical protein
MYFVFGQLAFLPKLDSTGSGFFLSGRSGRGGKKTIGAGIYSTVVVKGLWNGYFLTIPLGRFYDEINCQI